MLTFYKFYIQILYTNTLWDIIENISDFKRKVFDEMKNICLTILNYAIHLYNFNTGN